MSNNRHEFKGSSSIHAIDYDDEDGSMVIHFLSGGSHKYPDCPKEVYEGLKGSDSPGRHFHAHIRKQRKSEKI